MKGDLLTPKGHCFKLRGKGFPKEEKERYSSSREGVSVRGTLFRKKAKRLNGGKGGGTLSFGEELGFKWTVKVCFFLQGGERKTGRK